MQSAWHKGLTRSLQSKVSKHALISSMQMQPDVLLARTHVLTERPMALTTSCLVHAREPCTCLALQVPPAQHPLDPNNPANASSYLVHVCRGAVGAPGLRLAAAYFPGVHPTGPYHRWEGCGNMCSR